MAVQHLFSFRTPDGKLVVCQLSYVGRRDVEVQFFVDGRFRYSRRFPTRESALEWAIQERQDIETPPTADS